MSISECKLGVIGAKYKTPELEAEMAMEMLRFHMQGNHGQGQGITANTTASRNMRKRQKKPTAGMEMSEARWRDFEYQWAHYKHAFGMSGQDVVDDLVLCLSDTLRLEVTSELGDGLESVKEGDLLTAIKRMAALVSNPMVHRNQMRDHRQGESEKVRGFVARVREALVDCKFEVKCSAVSCDQLVS